MFATSIACAFASRCALLDIVRVKIRPWVLILPAILAAFALKGAVTAGSWETDFQKAQEEARSQHKLVFINFTGSDWCGYCIRMDRDVLSKPQFKDFANKNLVLVEVDFPRAKEQSQTLRLQNRKLAGEYGVEGFPTYVVLNGDGKKVWMWDGYFPGGPDAFVAELEKLRKS
jgi:thioredoxin-related protein